MGYFKDLSIELYERGVVIPSHCGEDVEVFALKDNLMECGCRVCGESITYIVNNGRTMPIPLEAHEVAIRLLDITERFVELNGNKVKARIKDFNEVLKIMGILPIKSIAYRQSTNSIEIEMQNRVLVEMFYDDGNKPPKDILDEYKEELAVGNGN